MDRKQIWQVKFKRVIVDRMFGIGKLILYIFSVCTFALNASEKVLPPLTLDDHQRDEDAYRLWREKYYSHFDLLERGQEMNHQTPYVSFNVARMFCEADIVLECSIDQVGNYRFGLDIVKPDRIIGVHKGALVIPKIEESSVDVKGIWILSNIPHTGRQGYCYLVHDEQYLLFLNALCDDEKKMLSLDKYNIPVYKINRIWHGAVRKKSSGKNEDGEANSRIMRDSRYKGLHMHYDDVISALRVLTNGVSSDDPATRTITRALLDSEIKFLNSIIDKTGEIALGDDKKMDFSEKTAGVSFWLWESLKTGKEGIDAAQIRERLHFRRVILTDVLETISKNVSPEKR
jgi:hypothetical protein